MGESLRVVAVCVLAVSGAVYAEEGVVLRSAAVSPLSNTPWPVPVPSEVEKLVAELKKDLPDYTIHKIGPWVIATNLSDKKAERFLEGTIATYAAQIQRQLFQKFPRRTPVKVLLFKDRLSYESGCKKLFYEIPDTPYGFYSRQYNSMAMNIGTGGGTLLHEMVHAMAETDFPRIPAWLNEGIGSLFEASDMRNDGSVIGVKNWRIGELVPAINNKSVTPLRELLAMSDERFYKDRSSLNYAVARYFMQYLQEHGKLEGFYSRYRDNMADTATTALLGMFGNAKTVEAIEAEYHEWVKKL